MMHGHRNIEPPSVLYLTAPSLLLGKILFICREMGLVTGSV